MVLLHGSRISYFIAKLFLFRQLASRQGNCHIVAEGQGKCTSNPGISDLAHNIKQTCIALFPPGRWLLTQTMSICNIYNLKLLVALPQVVFLYNTTIRGRLFSHLNNEKTDT